MAPTPAPPPAPPRSTTTTTTTTTTSAPPPAPPSTSRSSRPATPTGAAPGRAPRAQSLSIPALAHDLAALAAYPTILLAPPTSFRPAPAPEEAYAPPRPGVVDPATRGAELLDLLRRPPPEQEQEIEASSSSSPSDPKTSRPPLSLSLTRDDAPLLADAWVAALDRVIIRAEAHRRDLSGPVHRAEAVERWADQIGRGLAAGGGPEASAPIV